MLSSSLLLLKSYEGIEMPYYYPIDYRPNYEPKAESYIQFASGYRNLIRRALRDMAQDPPIHDYSLAPIVLLLSHYIELMLKGVIHKCRTGEHEPIGTHNIEYLYETAEQKVNQRYGDPGKENSDVKRFILELGMFDKSSQAFRYPENKRGDNIEFTGMDDWLYDRLCTLQGLHDIAEKVIKDLEGLSAYVDIVIENEQETYRHNDMNR